MFTVTKWMYNGDNKPLKKKEQNYLTYEFSNGEVDDTEIDEKGVVQVELYCDGDRVRFKDKDWDFVDCYWDLLTTK